MCISASRIRKFLKWTEVPRQSLNNLHFPMSFDYCLIWKNSRFRRGIYILTNSHDYHPPIWYHTHCLCDADCSSIYNQASSSIQTARFRTRPIQEPSSLIWSVFVIILTTGNDYRRPIWCHTPKRKNKTSQNTKRQSSSHVNMFHLSRHTRYGYFVVTICGNICVDCVGTFQIVVPRFCTFYTQTRLHFLGFNE